MSETITLIGDGNRIRQILLNIINNAVKFTRKRGITVDWDLITDVRQTTLAVRVSDTGVGIPPEELHRIFGRRR